MGERKSKESRKRLRMKVNSGKENSQQSHDDGLSIPTIIAQFVAIFAISTFIGLSLLHLSLIWRRIQYGDSELLYKTTMEEMMNQYYDLDVYQPPDRVDLRVNTSIFVM